MSNYDRRATPAYEQIACLERMNAELEAKLSRYEAAIDAVVDEKARLSVHLGGPVVIDRLNRAIAELKTLLEVDDE